MCCFYEIITFVFSPLLLLQLFCVYQYKVDMNIKENEKDVDGYFDMILLDEEGHVSEATVATEPKFRTIVGGTNTFVYYAEHPKLGEITEAKVKWTEKKKFYCFIYCSQKIHLDKISLILLQKNNKKHRIVNELCPADGESSIENGSFKKFVPCRKSSELGRSTLEIMSQSTVIDRTKSHSTTNVREYSKSTSTTVLPNSTEEESCVPESTSEEKHDKKENVSKNNVKETNQHYS